METPLFHLHPWRPCRGRSEVSSPTTRTRTGYESLIPFSSPLLFSSSRHLIFVRYVQLSSTSGCLCEGVQLVSPCFLLKSRASPPRHRPAPDIAKMGKNDPDAHPFASGDRSPLQDVTNSSLCGNAESSYATQKKSSLSCVCKMFDEMVEVLCTELTKL